MFPDFNELLSVFNAHSVKYLVVGATPPPHAPAVAACASALSGLL
jgi:hypothetical protein